jgi:lysophospholipase L1-like esterase
MRPFNPKMNAINLRRSAATMQRIAAGWGAKIVLLIVALGFAVLPALSRADTLPIKSGQSIAFLGDSITANGWNQKTGYVHLVVSGLQAAGVDVVPIPAGISGNTSKDMLARLDRDVLSKKPDWMTLSCGVNDVWHGVNGVSLDQYKINITYIVDQAQAAGIKVMILTSTPIHEDPNNDDNQKLAAYNDFLHRLAVQKGCLLAGVGAAMADVNKAHPGPAHYLTMDGVHPIGLGNEIMAIPILKAFGVSDAQIALAKAQWDNIPDGWPVVCTYQDPNGIKDAHNQPNRLVVVAELSIAQYEALNTAAEAQGTTETDIIHALFRNDVLALLKPEGNYDSVDAIFAAHQQDAVQKQINDHLDQQVQAQLTQTPKRQ